MWPLEISVAAAVIAALVISAAGYQLVSVADEVADRTGAGEAVIGATLLGATTSLADITAVLSSAVQGYASLAVSAAVGGIAVQTAFLAVADIALRRVNLEHAAASLPNLLSTTVLILILSLVLVAALGPPIEVWQVHPVSILLFVVYGFGVRLVHTSHQRPMWHPRMTAATQLDEEATNAVPRSGQALAGNFVIAGGLVAGSGWMLSEAAQSLMHHLGLIESAVGALIIGVGTSLPELVTSVAAVRRGALTLAVGGIIGGNVFDSLMVGMADSVYREGSIYHHAAPQDLVLIASTLIMTATLLLGLLFRQRAGPGNIGLESLVVLVVYGASVVLLNMHY